MSKDTNLKNPHWDIQELTAKTQIQKDNFERSKRKKVVTYKGSPLPIRQSMDFFSRNIIGKGNIIKRNRNMHPFLEGKGCYIQIPGGKWNTRIKHLAKQRGDKGFYQPNKSQRIHQHEANLTRNAKGSFTSQNKKC